MKVLVLIASVIASSAIAQDAPTGATLFADHCAVCHGVQAAGNGPMAPVLTIQPTDLTQLAARNDGVFPTARVAARIDGRDPLVAHGSPMWVFGEFFDAQGPDIALQLPAGERIMVSGPIADLVAWIETIQVRSSE